MIGYSVNFSSLSPPPLNAYGELEEDAFFYKFLVLRKHVIFTSSRAVYAFSRTL